jgi:hypothetical protein
MAEDKPDTRFAALYDGARPAVRRPGSSGVDLLAGLAAAAGALWHIVFILPEAWPTTLAWGALGLYLALRGAGPASLDWMAARLARLG